MSGMSGILSAQSSVFGSTAYSHRESALQNSGLPSFARTEKPFAPPTDNNLMNPMNPLDSANISDAGRKAAEVMQIDAQKTQKEEIKVEQAKAEQAKVEQVKTIVGSGTLDSGARVSVYTMDYAEGEEKPIGGPEQKIMAEITKKDGSIETLAITENTVINEDADGNLQVFTNLMNYSNGNSDGDDVVIMMSGHNSANAGDGDNTIIFMGDVSGEGGPTSGSEGVLIGRGLSLGSGDNKIIVNGNVNNFNIVHDKYGKGHTGDISVLVKGDVNGLSIHESRAGLGINGATNGDKTVKVEGNASNLSIATRDGDNIVTVDGNASNLILSSWKGDNNLIVEGDLNGLNMAAHDGGDNNLLVKGDASDLDVGAPGFDAESNLTFEGDVNGLNVWLGFGSTNVSIEGDATNVKYELTDMIKEAKRWYDKIEDPELKAMQSSIYERINSATHNLTVNGSVNGGNIDTGGGSGNISILGDVSGLKINLGDGINSFLLEGNADFLDYKSGNGKDNVSVGGNFSNSTLNTGGGGDTVSIDGNVNSSNIKTGAEQDKTGKENNTFSLGGLIHNSVIDGETYAKFRPEWVPSFG